MSRKQGNPKRSKLGCLTTPFVWWFKGRWWVKTIKMAALAVILYNIVTFVLMWCPPVKGVVLDIDTGKPIAGAIVYKYGAGPFLGLIQMTQAAGRTGGGRAQTVTEEHGRFSFDGAISHPTTKTCAASDVYYPFQWLDSVHIVVWQKDYIGAESAKKGMWWTSEKPRRSRGYCKITRYRIPILGYRYKIFLKKPDTEVEWQVKIGSVNLDGIGGGHEVEDERLFNDLTGYLQRWPDGKKAGVYIMKLVDLGLAMYEPFWDSPISNPAQRKKCLAAEQTILKWVDSRPVEQITSNPLEQKVLPKERQIISDAITQMLEQDTNNFSGGKNAD